MEAAHLRDQLLAAARRDFSAFYATATLRDVALFDALVLSHANLVVGINSPREGLPPLIRIELERATNGNEQLFTELREQARACATYNALPDTDQNAIVRVLFNVKSPPFLET